MYEKQTFYSGQPLQASQLNTMEDGIILAQEIAQGAKNFSEEAKNIAADAQIAAENAQVAAEEASKGASNMQVGTGASATQQLPDGVADGFNFSGKNPNATTLDSTLTDIIPYGATGDFASAFGGKCAAQGKRSQAIGTTTIAKGNYSSAEGDNSVALGIASHAEGGVTVTNGYGAHSEGSGTQALGDASHAEGYNTTASIGCAHAEGNGTTASAESAHAEGFETVASGAHSHAEGARAKAQAEGSHAEGIDTVASGYCSHAAGYNTTAGQAYQTVIGHYNNNKTNTLFEIGNGNNASSRTNAFEIYEDGTIGIKYGGNTYSLQKILEALSGFLDSAKI